MYVQLVLNSNTNYELLFTLLLLRKWLSPGVPERPARSGPGVEGHRQGLEEESLSMVKVFKVNQK